MSEKLYPADFTLDEWLRLRRGWRDPIGDEKFWKRAKHSVLGPNLLALSNPAPGSSERYRLIRDIEDRARLADAADDEAFLGVPRKEESIWAPWERR